MVSVFTERSSCESGQGLKGPHVRSGAHPDMTRSTDPSFTFRPVRDSLRAIGRHSRGVS
jgi:hypothetical protein